MYIDVDITLNFLIKKEVEMKVELRENIKPYYFAEIDSDVVFDWRLTSNAIILNVKQNKISKSKKEKQKFQEFVDAYTADIGNLVLTENEEKLLNSISDHKDYTSIKRSQAELRKRISYNFPDNSKWIGFSLTYEKDKARTEHTKVSKDFENFIKSLRLEYEPTFGTIDYVYMKERREDLTYHIHGILLAKQCKGTFKIVKKRKNKKEKKGIYDIWNKGWVDVQCGKKIRSAYTYLLPHKTNSVNIFARKMNGKLIRLILMPKKSKIYNYSKGIVPAPSGKIDKKSLEPFLNKIRNIGRTRYNSFYSSKNKKYIRDYYQEFVFDLDIFSEEERKMLLEMLKKRTNKKS